MICSLCDARCCKNRLITITAFDALRIEERFNELRFVRLVPPRILNIDYDFLLKCKEGEFLLALDSYPCKFLKGKVCSIYDFAPMVCKLYPFSLNKKIGDVMCPPHLKVLFKIRGVDERIVEQFKYEIEEYRKMVKEWNEIGGSKEECIKFLIEKAKKRKFKNIV